MLLVVGLLCVIGFAGARQTRAACKKDGATAKIKLAEITATCGECHAKIRDKK